MKTKSKSLTDLSTFDPMLKDTPPYQVKRDIQFRCKPNSYAQQEIIKYQINRDYLGF